MVGGRDAEEDEGTRQVNGGSNLRRSCGRQAHEDDGRGQGQRGGGQVQPAAKLGLDLHELAREPLLRPERCDVHPFPRQPVNISYESVGYYTVTCCDRRVLALRE